MQQLQTTRLQQISAWQHQLLRRRSCKYACCRSSDGHRPWATSPPGAVHALLLHASREQPCMRIRCAGAAADGAPTDGDIVRPSAKAAAPPAGAVDVAGQGGAAGSSSTYQSYSDMYKLLNSSSYKKPADSKPQGKAQPGSTASHHGSASSGSSTSGVSQHCSAETLSVDSISHEQNSSNSSGSPAPVSTAAVDPAGVEDAIRKAQEALALAESSLSSIHQLRSANPASKWTGIMQLLRSIVAVAAAGALLVASHAFGLGWQWAGSTLGALGLAARAFQRQTVTPAAAALVAAASLATLGCSLRFGLVMLAYSYTSLKLRQFRENRMLVDYDQVIKPATRAPRNWAEILCISFVPTVLAVAYGAMAGCLDLPLGSVPGVETWRADLLTLLQGAVLGWYACCCGDAWATELGSLSSDQPRLITTLQPVRRGTHGAVTLLGLSGAAAGGLLMGLLFYCAAVLAPTLWVFDLQRQAAMSQWRLIPLGLIAGVFGSLVDSLIGASLQFTGYNSKTSSLSSTPGPEVSRISGLLSQAWISDNVVNVLAGSVTAVLTALAALRMFG